MARPRSDSKRRSILQAALLEFADNGLSAPTARIAKRAGVATGTLFTYFATKEELQNALYLELKSQVYRRMNEGFPSRSSLEGRLHHLWLASLLWASELPAKRKVSLQLNLSDVLTPATRQAASAMSGPVALTLVELEQRAALRDLPRGLATAAMSSMQDVALNLYPTASKAKRNEVWQQAFRAFWRTVR